jgi:hypothetical protein
MELPGDLTDWPPSRNRIEGPKNKKPKQKASFYMTQSLIFLSQCIFIPVNFHHLVTEFFSSAPHKNEFFVGKKKCQNRQQN